MIFPDQRDWHRVGANALARDAAGGVGGTKAIRGGPSMKRRARSIFGFWIVVFLGMLPGSCAAHAPKIEGTVGAIHWHVTDLGRWTPTGYPFTLVLAETQGVGMQITNIGWRAYQPGIVPASGFTDCSQMTQVQWQVHLPKCPDRKGWRLAANEELRIPLSIGTIFCPQNCPPINPSWEVTVAGTDDQGRPVRAQIDIRLPAR
jgi:hypothetical protein